MRHSLRAAALVSMLTLGVAEARYTCTSIVRRGDADPETQVFTNKFEEPTGVNAAGDLGFIGRAGKQQRTVYSYPNAGTATVVARVADPAPGGSAYSRFAASSFGSVSINPAATSPSSRS
jgi:hypothetical protein